MSEEIEKRIVDAYDRATRQLDVVNRQLNESNDVIRNLRIENGRLLRVIGTLRAMDRNYYVSVHDLGLSVRARKCMIRLGISTIGDLINRTEADLLECKNFGVTTVNEIREKLAERGSYLVGEEPT